MNVMSIDSRSTLTRCKRTFVGLWLASLYIICVSAVIYSLSSFQIQNRLSSIPLISTDSEEELFDHKCKVSDATYKQILSLGDTLPSSMLTLECQPNISPRKIRYYSFGDILPAIEKNNVINSKIKAAKNVDIALQELIDKTTADIKRQRKIEQAMRQDINIKIGQIKQKNLNDFVTKTRQDRQSLNNAIIQRIHELESPSAGNNNPTEYLDILKIASEANKQKASDELNIIQKAAEANHEKIEEEVQLLTIAAEENNQKANNELSIIKTANIENSNKLQSLLAEKSELLHTNHAFADVLSNIEYYENFFKWVSDLLGTPPFWALPKSILTLLLVLSTGVLGSIIFVTVEFLKEPADQIQNLTMYLFRPFLGMILALSVYVMLKAGQFTFVDDSDQNLSPFLVSFLGIISGMLAEEAYKRLTKAGGAFINPPPNAGQ